MRHRFPPNKTFFIITSVANLDGTIELDGDEMFETKEAAVRHAELECHGHGIELYVHRCVPIARLTRTSVTIQELDEPRGLSAAEEPCSERVTNNTPTSPLPTVAKGGE
jgi:hypothetical protein